MTSDATNCSASDDTEPNSTRAESGGELESVEEGRTKGLGRAFGLALIAFYQQAVSPALPPSCRYRPTCSEYTRTAIERYGLLRGSWLGLKRLLRCHPFHPGGHDPVP